MQNGYKCKCAQSERNCLKLKWTHSTRSHTHAAPRNTIYTRLCNIFPRSFTLLFSVPWLASFPHLKQTFWFSKMDLLCFRIWWSVQMFNQLCCVVLAANVFAHTECKPVEAAVFVLIGLQLLLLPPFTHTLQTTQCVVHIHGHTWVTVRPDKNLTAYVETVEGNTLPYLFRKMYHFCATLHK